MRKVVFALLTHPGPFSCGDVAAFAWASARLELKGERLEQWLDQGGAASLHAAMALLPPLPPLMQSPSQPFPQPPMQPMQPPMQLPSQPSTQPTQTPMQPAQPPIQTPMQPSTQPLIQPLIQPTQPPKQPPTQPLMQPPIQPLQAPFSQPNPQPQGMPQAPPPLDTKPPSQPKPPSWQALGALTWGLQHMGHLPSRPLLSMLCQATLRKLQQRAQPRPEELVQVRTILRKEVPRREQFSN